MALEMQNFEALSPPVVKKITWWTLLYILTSVETEYNTFFTLISWKIDAVGKF